MIRSVISHLLVLFFICSTTSLSTEAHKTCSQERNQDSMTTPLKFAVRCKCGKVGASIQALETAPPLRLVCYCKDCRGYFNALNHMADDEKKSHSAVIDKWGGVDWTFVYPHDIVITDGKEFLKTGKIRDKSSIRQVYSTCCLTPMFRFGANSVLLNTDLIPMEAKPEVKYRIIGRQAVTPPQQEADEARPKISWSVPFGWFWNMPKRIHKELMTPMPLEINEKDVTLLKHFKEG